MANGQKERRRYYSIISPVLAAAAAKPSHLGEVVDDAVLDLGGLHHHHHRLVGRVHLYLCEERRSSLDMDKEL